MKRNGSQSDPTRLKRRFDIEEYARSHYGIEFSDSGVGRCPFGDRHNNGDSNPSLRLDRKNQTMRCWSQGCFGDKGADLIDLVQIYEGVNFKEAVGLLEREEGIATTTRTKSIVTGRFDYQDEAGNLLFFIERLEPGKNGRAKSFVAKKPDGTLGTKGVRLVPYRLPDWRETDTVVIVEGERCVDSLLTLGIPATTNPFGAGKWRDDYSDHLSGKTAIIWPDKDDAGERHAIEVAASVRPHAREVRILDPPDSLPAKGDVVDGIDAGWARSDVEAILASASPWKGETPPPPPAFRRTDDWNAERFEKRHGTTVRYSYGQGWLVFTGARWELDRLGEGRRMAVETIRAIPEEAMACDDPEEARSMLKWASTSLSDTRTKAMMESAKAKGQIPAVPEQFDRNHYLLNLRNGTFDLANSSFREHRQEDLITKLAPVDYDPHAQSPTWLRFLDRVLGGDKDLLDYIQKAIGYSLTGSTAEECLFILYGTGANGKSTFVETIGSMLGNYALQTPTEMLMVRRSDAPTNDLARLRGARFVAAAESEEGGRLAESRVKGMTGGDRITARFLHKEFFDFVPECKIWISSNHKPVIRGTDHAIWRRIRLIPFEVQIPEDEQDPDLKGHDGKLHAEMSGILNWALKGYQAWKKERLSQPARVLGATGDYRSEMDTLGRFISERCVEAQGYTAAVDALYVDYKGWCEENGEAPLTKTAVGRKFSDRGYERGKRGGKRIWRGLGLRSAATDPNASTP